MTHEHFLIFDIETMALPFDSFSESQQEYLVRGANTDEDKEKKLSEMALTPMTAQIICLGLQLMQKNDTGGYEEIKRAAYTVDNSLTDDEKVTADKLNTGEDCYFCTEKKLLETFWKIMKKYNNIHLVSFNGRNFDAPFIMLRSALHRIKPSRNLMSGTKFNYGYHTDLIDELCFYNPSAYGATKRFNFDFYTRSFGITSPKSEGIDGSKVADFYKEGKIKEIAEYCLRDVKATWELYKVWSEYLKF